MIKKHFLQLDKEKLAYFDNQTDKPLLLLIHGNMSAARHYSPLWWELSQHYRLIAPDLRGFGDSSYNQEFNSLKDLALDLKEFLDLLRIDKCQVLGWSAGAAIALQLAALYPKMISSLFSIAGIGYLGYPYYKKSANDKITKAEVFNSKEEMAKDSRQVAPVIKLLADGDTKAMETIWDKTIYTVGKPRLEDKKLWLQESMKQRCLADFAWALANFNLSAIANGYNEGDNTIVNITCPCIFTTAQQDRVLPGGLYSPAATVAALGNNARLIEYNNCGHFPLIDVKPQLIKDIMEATKV